MLKVIHIFVIAVIMGYSAFDASDTVRSVDEKPKTQGAEKVPTFIPVPATKCIIGLSEEALDLRQCVNVKKEWLHI